MGRGKVYPAIIDIDGLTTHQIWRDVNDIKFKDPTAGTKTLSELAAGGGVTDKVVFASPSDGYIVQNCIKNPGYINFPDNTLDIWVCSGCKVPKGCTSISSIKVFYSGDSIGDLDLQFDFTNVKVAAPAILETDTTGEYQTAGSASDNKIYAYSLPSTAYNGLTIAENDIISMKISRGAGYGADTYNADWKVYGVEFTFA